MRYDDWDVLLFPGDSKVPIKEFKVGCQVINDHEFSRQPGHYSLLPVMTCFIPSLSAGEPFSISCHSWHTPTLSPQSRSYTRHPELIKYEARVFIDGALVAIDFSKTGELNPLTFPAFDEQVIHQNYWSAADTWGRIKLVISEGFVRDSAFLFPGMERVKNIVVFSFQHAPLHVLEAASIAWPCPSMWRCTPLTAISPVPTQRPEEGSDSHLHSPRRQAAASARIHTASVAAAAAKGIKDPRDLPRVFGTQYQTPGPYVSSSQAPAPNPIGASALDWGRNLNKDVGTTAAGLGYGDARFAAYRHPAREGSLATSGDLSMPDYASSSYHGGHANMPFQGDGTFEGDRKSEVMYQRRGGDGTAVPCRMHTNTPIGSEGGGLTNCASYPQTYIDTELAATLANSFIELPAGPLSDGKCSPMVPAFEVKSRKENQVGSSGARVSSAAAAAAAAAGATREISTHGEVERRVLSRETLGLPPTEATVRRASTNENVKTQAWNMVDRSTSMASHGSTKQGGAGLDRDRGVRGVRNFTPASTRAIDLEDEPQRYSRVPSLAERLSAIE
ncbi:hypothetical protein SODALDRAFT_351450 [Sodiomyces alkalinus F11]|uniref:Uncharacterized protein n=1 Tax=Sodiomyces alkalinus (strain CBS 110278 / VKM F-3762 / F11) TaxID=1314773 RepID=A0A3N2PRU6_SODAK|nr:hypothetical protein SODALDRAFT_351450 [Sodiomyces alkalinus F11]ROT37086.1 hypothetical protein SODALDRAFT_351450 [Sodiomyces alkalinus F11]